jgi:hypothetical protein
MIMIEYLEHIAKSLKEDTLIHHPKRMEDSMDSFKKYQEWRIENLKPKL